MDNKPDTSPESIAQVLINHNLDYFEQLLLVCAFQSCDFFRHIDPALCPDPSKPIQDFQHPLYNALYAAIRQYYVMQLQRSDLTNEPEAPARQTLRTMLFVQVQKPGSGINDTEVDEALGIIDQSLAGTPYDQAYPLAKAGFEYWIKKKKITRLANAETSRTDWNPDTFVEALTNETASIKSFKEDAVIASGSIDIFHMHEEKGKKYKTYIDKFDNATAGGLSKKECTLMVAPTGGGKTVMSSQLANVMSLQNDLCGILAFTEQEYPDYMNRIISQFTNIEFSKLESGLTFEGKLDPSKFSNYELDKLEHFQKTKNNPEKGFIHFIDWKKLGSRASIVNDLNAQILDFKRTYNRKPDFLIFDWIGKALSNSMVNVDQSNARFLFKAAAEHLAHLAVEENMITVGFVQASISTAYNKKAVGQQDVAEVKNIGESATNVIGISALIDPSALSNPGTALYQKDQFLYMDKARKGIGTMISVKRNFAVQRFDSLSL